MAYETQIERPGKEQWQTLSVLCVISTYSVSAVKYFLKTLMTSCLCASSDHRDIPGTDAEQAGSSGVSTLKGSLPPTLSRGKQMQVQLPLHFCGVFSLLLKFPAGFTFSQP